MAGAYTTRRSQHHIVARNQDSHATQQEQHCTLTAVDESKAMGLVTMLFTCSALLLGGLLGSDTVTSPPPAVGNMDAYIDGGVCTAMGDISCVIVGSEAVRPAWCDGDRVSALLGRE